jgi:hypothetical protein
VRRTVLAVCLMLVVAGCTADRSAPDPAAASPGSGVSAPSSEPPICPSPGPASPDQAPPDLSGDRYAVLAQALHQRGVAIWWETDLVARWTEGKSAFEQAFSRLGELAKLPGTAGFKVADEIGYRDDMESPAEVAEFLRQTRNRLATVAPGKQILVDAVVPELGCLPWRGSNQEGCAQRVRLKYPAASAAAIESYLQAGLIDRLDLSTSLLPDSTYTKWGLSRREAQSDAWNRVRAQGWGALTILQARKALAEPDGYQGTAAQAADDAAVYVDIPVTAGAKAVDIWTWRQRYQGSMVSLLGPDLTANSLWSELLRRKREGVQLITHMTPSTMPTDAAGFAHECELAATAFAAVFVAAGTG